MSDATPDPLAAFRAVPAPPDPRASTLLRPPHPPEEGETVVLGLPYDGGIPTRPGARFGPKAIREALAAFGTYDGDREVANASDWGDLPLPTMNGAEAHARIEAAAHEVFAAGARAIFLGGDHGCTGSVIRGLAAARPGLRLGVISIDAHLDVREYADDASLSSGTPFRRALESGIVEGGRVAMIGIRRFANSRYYLDWAREREITLITLDELAVKGAVNAAKAALYAATRDADALYLSIDMDAADAAFAPGVSATGIGGLTAREMIDIVTTIASHPKLIGADVMELSPPYDHDARTAKLAARLVLELLAGRTATAP
ncbi:agmatinase family protein [Longimicrobium sp.]|uniref:agmatinase family protein n=1 Tax=Longimicrobium sp. TaxID=2029185 RepID=UPI002C77D1F2|nr:agmatinase family protein [Longimicrobium sp.]HSU12647.1 agmatinase family protein [Longimicrobium sp.]